MSTHNPWCKATQSFTGALATAASDDRDDTLELFVEEALRAANSADAALYLPSVGGSWICELAAGKEALSLVGTFFDVAPPIMSLLEDGEPVGGGNTLYLPLHTGGILLGCLVVRRDPEADSFADEDKADAMMFVRQGALTLDLISSSQVRDFAVLLEERERISRDLHDLGIQDLFATGMLLQKLHSEVEDGLSRRRTCIALREAMDHLDEAVHQIRRIVYRLRDEDDEVGLVDALEREASKARTSLGFAPTLVFEVDGAVLAPGSQRLEEFREEAPERVASALSEDIVATVREALTNVARHARAHSAQVRVSVFGRGLTGEVEVVIVDDGKGVDPSRDRNSGLSNMLRRAEAHGGSFAMSSGPRGRGTSLVWRSPLG